MDDTYGGETKPIIINHHPIIKVRKGKNSVTLENLWEGKALEDTEGICVFGAMNFFNSMLLDLD